MIFFDERRNTITLSPAATTYQMKVDSTGVLLMSLIHICNKLSSEIGKELVKIRPEILNRLENAGATLVLEDAVKKPLFSFSTTGKICAAFIHGGSAATSKWVYNHEYGRYLLDNTCLLYTSRCV